jgi:hypothetical protein
MSILTDKVGFSAAFSGRQLFVRMKCGKKGRKTALFELGE